MDRDQRGSSGPTHGVYFVPQQVIVPNRPRATAESSYQQGSHSSRYPSSSGLQRSTTAPTAPVVANPSGPLTYPTVNGMSKPRGDSVNRLLDRDPSLARNVHSLYERRLNDARRLLDNLHLIRARCESSRNHFVRVERDVRDFRAQIEEDMRVRYELLRRQLDDLFEFSLKRLDSREQELLDPVLDGMSQVDDLFREVNRCVESLQLKFQVESKAEFIENFHILQEEVENVMFVETPQVRMPNLNFLTSNLGFDTVFVISDVEDLGSEESRADVFKNTSHIQKENLRKSSDPLSVQPSRDQLIHRIQDKILSGAQTDNLDVKSDERGSGFRRRRKRQTQPPVSDVQNELIHQLTRSYKDLLKQYNHARESQQKLAEELRRGLGSFGTDHIASRIETLETHLREEVEKLNENLIMRLEPVEKALVRLGRIQPSLPRTGVSSHHALDSVVSGATMSSNSLSSPVDLKTDVLGDHPHDRNVGDHALRAPNSVQTSSLLSESLSLDSSPLSGSLAELVYPENRRTNSYRETKSNIRDTANRPLHGHQVSLSVPVSPVLGSELMTTDSEGSIGFGGRYGYPGARPQDDIGSLAALLRRELQRRS